MLLSESEQGAEVWNAGLAWRVPQAAAEARGCGLYQHGSPHPHPTPVNWGQHSCTRLR